MTGSVVSAPAIPGSDAPLGVFDSGIGGLTVVRALRELLPYEDIIYLGDTARVPYGTRSAATVMKYADGCARLLCAHGIKALVVACNTVSAVAIEMLQVQFDIPVIGVVEPGALAAVRAVQAQAGSSHQIGVLATSGTIASGAYERAVARHSTRYQVVARAAPLLVPLVEEGWIDGTVPELALARYLEPLLQQGCRVVLLGCTHYPLLGKLIDAVSFSLCGEHVRVVDSAQATAQYTVELLQERQLLRSAGPGSLQLLVTDLPSSFESSARRFLGADLPPARQVDIVSR